MGGRAGDGEVIARILAGATDDFAELIERYKGEVFRIVSRYVPYQSTAEVAQDVFVAAYTSLGTLRDGDQFAGWLSRVAVRRCYDFWREQRRRTNREVLQSALGQEHQEWFEGLCARAATDRYEDEQRRRCAREILNWAVSQLGPADRMVLLMVYLEGRSVAETAEALGWSTVNVKVRAHRARRRLRALLLKQLEDQ